MIECPHCRRQVYVLVTLPDVDGARCFDCQKFDTDDVLDRFGVNEPPKVIYSSRWYDDDDDNG